MTYLCYLSITAPLGVLSRPISIALLSVVSTAAVRSYVVTMRRRAVRRASRVRLQAAGVTRRIKVAVLTRHFPTSHSQWSGHAAFQTLRLLAKVCDVKVFYPEFDYVLMRPSREKLPEIDMHWQPPGVETMYKTMPLFPVLSRPLNGFTMTRTMMKEVRAYEPDLLLSYFVYPDGFAAVKVARALGVPSLVTAVGSDLNRIPNLLVQWLVQWTLRKADYVSAVSHDLIQTARTLGASAARSSANLNGCDTSIFYPRDRREARAALGIAEEGEIIVYVGRLDARKGLGQLARVMGRLQHKRPGVRCYIVGDGPARQKLGEIIRDAGSETSVTLIPSVLTDKVALWMAAADVITLPSYAEGCPNVVVEGLSSGRPVVATSVGGIPELMDDSCGRLIPPRNEAALETALEETLDGTWNAQEISAKHGRSWDDVALWWREIFSEVLEDSRKLDRQKK